MDHLPLDPRGIKVRTTQLPNEEESLRPFLWRFWCHTPSRGRITVFDRSWYRRLTVDRVAGAVRGEALEQAFADILSFERQLTDSGVAVTFALEVPTTPSSMDSTVRALSRRALSFR